MTVLTVLYPSMYIPPVLYNIENIQRVLFLMI